MARTTLLLLLTLACSPSFDPPDHPVHEVEEGGARHAERLDYPFNCGGGDKKVGVPCPPERPEDDFVSCDASGCHGTLYSPNNAVEPRELFGSDGPSCYTCHGEKWKQK